MADTAIMHYSDTASNVASGKSEAAGAPETKTQMSPIGHLQQSPEGFIDAPLQPIKDRKDGLPLKGLSPAKAYLEGRLMLAACFKPRSRSKGQSRCIACYEFNPRDGSAALERDVFYERSLSGGEQDHVFVGDVEIVNREQVRAIPSRERLYLVEDAGDDVITGGASQCFMSIHGGFFILQIPFRDERESRPLVNGVAIGFDEGTVRVIEGGRWGVAGK